MVKVIMHGCNGKMGQVITGIIAEDKDVEIVAGVDTSNHIQNTYPVFGNIADCNVEADVVIDFCAAPAVDGLLKYCNSSFSQYVFRCEYAVKDFKGSSRNSCTGRI